MKPNMCPAHSQGSPLPLPLRPGFGTLSEICDVQLTCETMSLQVIRMDLMLEISGLD